MSAAIDLTQPLTIRAEMARNGFAPRQMDRYWSPDTDSMIDPLADAESRDDVRRFMVRLWDACLAAERDEEVQWQMRNGVTPLSPESSS